MFKADVPKKIVAEKSGHKSLKALHIYKHISTLQEQTTGVAIINGEQYSLSGDVKSDSSETELPIIEKSDKKSNIDVNGQGQSSPLQLPTF